MIRKQDEHTAAEVAAHDEDTAADEGLAAPDGDDKDAGDGEIAIPETPGPLADDASDAELAEAEEAFRQRARARRTMAAQAREQAEQIKVSGQAEIERITKFTREEAHRLGWTVAQAAERDAAEDEGRASPIAEARRRRAEATRTAQHGLDLAAERETLAGRVATWNARIAELAADRQHLEGQLGAARDAGDAAAITSLRGRLGGVEEASVSLSAQRDAARSRMDAIGTDDGQGELFRALSAVRRDMAEYRKMINLAFPERQEAQADRLAADLADALGAMIEAGHGLAEEQRKPQGQVTIQHVGNTAMIQRR